jgi:hypothetical protein
MNITEIRKKIQCLYQSTTWHTSIISNRLWLKHHTFAKRFINILCTHCLSRFHGLGGIRTSEGPWGLSVISFTVYSHLLGRYFYSHSTNGLSFNEFKSGNWNPFTSCIIFGSYPTENTQHIHWRYKFVDVVEALISVSCENQTEGLGVLSGKNVSSVRTTTTVLVRFKKLQSVVWEQEYLN